MIDRDMTIWRQRDKMIIKLNLKLNMFILYHHLLFFHTSQDGDASIHYWRIYQKNIQKKLKSTMITIKRLQVHIKDTFIFKEDDLVMVQLCLEIFYSGTCEKLQTKNVGSFQWSATKFFSNYIIFNARDWISSSQII